MCPADNATAGSLGRRRAGQLRFGFVAVLKGHIVYSFLKTEYKFLELLDLIDDSVANVGVHTCLILL
jgi:hypothetical protein